MTTTESIMTTPRRERGTYLGGHQIAAVLGLHPYMTIGHVYERSVYRVDDVDPNAPPIRRGRICEPGLVEEARKIDEVPLERWRRDVFVQDPAVPFFAGTVDAMSLDADGNPDTIYEVTTCTTRTLHLWGEGPEDCARYKWVQSQWYMGICGARRARVFAFVADTDDLREYTVPRAGGAIEDMRDVGERFWWEHIIERVPPAPDAFGILCDPEQASEIMNRIYRADPEGREIPPQPELVSAAERYAAARDAKGAAEVEMAAAAAQLKGALQGATLMKWGKGRVSWTRNKASPELDEEAFVKSLALRAGINDEQVVAIRRQYTTMKEGPRVMRVTMTNK